MKKEEMAKTVKSGGKYYREGVEVPAPKKQTQKKQTPKKKMNKRKEIDLKKAWSNESERRRKFSWGK